MKQRHALAVGATLALISGSLFQSISLRAQDPKTPPTVTFQVEVDYVDVDTVVTDENGAFVTGLTRDDFEVFEDGKPQKVDMFSYVEIPFEKPDRFAGIERAVAPDTQSNQQPFTGRLYVIVLDDINVSFLRSVQVRRAARQFVEQYIGANDRAAVAYTSGRSDGSQEFTGDRQRLLTAIDRFSGRRLRSPTLDSLDATFQRIAMETLEQNPEVTPGELGTTDNFVRPKFDPNDFERGYRAIGVMDTLKNVSEFLASVRGRRKAVIFFSEGIDYPINDVFGARSATDVVRAMQDAITMAARSNVNYFTIDPRGLVGMTPEFMEMQGADWVQMGGAYLGPTGVGGVSGPTNIHTELLNEFMVSQNTLRTLAEETGGIASVSSNSLLSAFERIVAANSRYYVLGYYPPTHPRDGRFHKIEVRVKRPGLKVVARRGYGSPRGRTPEELKRDEAARRAREARRPDADKTSDELRLVLSNPMQESGLTIRVQAAPFRNTPKDASVALAIEIDGSRLQFAPPNDKGLVTNNVELSFFSINQDGKAQKGTRSELSLTLRPDTHERVKAYGMRFNPRMTISPGRYQVRIGVREETGGQTGSVFIDLDVPDFRKEKLMMSGLLLTAPTVQRYVTVEGDPVLSKLLPTPATSRREFAQTDVLTLYSEIYDNISSTVPREIDVVMRLISESGTEVLTARDTLASGGTQREKSLFHGYSRQIPLNDVPAGRYLLRVEGQVRGNIENAKPVARETLIQVVAR